MPTVQQLLINEDGKIDYSELISKYKWITERNQNCIISPDSDGMLCALLMNNFLGWKVKGFYDGKVLLAEKGVNPSDCVFLDMEILRKGVKSVGQHMIVYNAQRDFGNLENYRDCLSPNLLRGYDGYHTFRLKYPFGTVHFLLGILGSQFEIKLEEKAIAPLLFTDGTWMNLFKYTENSLSWLSYLKADRDGPLKDVFLNTHYSMYESLHAMNNFLRKRDEISIPRERGDRLTLTLRGGDGTPHNLTKLNDVYMLDNDPKERIEKFLNLLGDLTGFTYNPNDWTWTNWKMLNFTKKDFISTGMRLNNGNYEKFVKGYNPMSLAQTSGNNIEFTVESPSSLF